MHPKQCIVFGFALIFGSCGPGAAEDRTLQPADVRSLAEAYCTARTDCACFDAEATEVCVERSVEELTALGAAAELRGQVGNAECFATRQRAFETMGCGLIPTPESRFDYFSPCELYVGDVEPGAPCEQVDIGETCVEGYQCSDAGQCEQRGGNDAVCNEIVFFSFDPYYACGPDLACGAVAEPQGLRVCGDIIPAGGSCTPTPQLPGYCEPDYYCACEDAQCTAGTCEPLPSDGEECSEPSTLSVMRGAASCAEGLYCDDEAPTPTCRPRRAEGEHCGVATPPCSEYLICSSVDDACVLPPKPEACENRWLLR